MPKRNVPITISNATPATTTLLFATFGEALKFLRKRARLTQDELGRAVGYSREQIARLESGKRLPDLAVIAALFAPTLGLHDDPATLAHLLHLAGQARGEEAPHEITITRTVRKHVQFTELVADTAANHQRNHQLSAAAPPSTFAPIPSTLFPLVGREDDLQAACELLRNEARLLTLVGPPGVGKTRLAVQIGHTLASTFASGAHFLSLAPLSDATALPAALASALGLKPDALLTYLSQRETLLVLDNFEHVLPAAGFVSDWLAAAPGLRVLATSRTALDLYGEHVFDIEPLLLPNLASLPPASELAHVPAVQLFLSRARAAHAKFRLSASNALPIAAICVVLDGLPLALELAAAHIREMEPQTLLQQLVAARSQNQLSSPSLSLLAQTKRDVAARHRTLQDAIAWSVNLLTPDQQTLFAVLGVFVGGFDERAAEEIRDWRPELEEASQSPISNLQSLISSNLLQHHTHPISRYNLLETLRAFALEQLSQLGLLDKVARKHAHYFLRVAENATSQSYATNQANWRAIMATEYDNMAAALNWAVAHAEGDVALRLAVALSNHWEKYGNLNEGLRSLQQALSIVDDATQDSESHAQALLAAGILAYRQSNYALAQSLLHQALPSFQQLGNTAGAARTLNNLGNVALDQGLHALAQQLYEDSLRLRRQLNDTFGIASTLNNLGDLAHRLGHYARAIAIYQESLAHYRHINNTWSIASVLTSLGNTALQMDDLDAARTYFNDSRAARQTIGDDGRYLSRGLAHLALRTGDYASAITHFQNSLRISWQAQEHSNVLECLRDLAVAFCAANIAVPSAQLLGATDALLVQLNVQPDATQQHQHDETLAKLRDALGEHVFAQAYAEGQAMTMAQAVAVAGTR
jgi:predicted ATPase/transcriptional regulator with XRE-family HTH domain